MIIGVDEVGRGAIAGPLVIGAVALETDPDLYKNKEGQWRIKPMPDYDWIKDSKLITKTERPLAARRIDEVALACSVGVVSSAEVDKMGLTKATTEAITRALVSMPDFDQVIIDGNYNYLPNEPRAIPITDADNFIPVVSAASIIAKVYRDNLMQKYSGLYPEFGFDEHVGYSTPRHKQALVDHVPCDIHRREFEPVKLAIIHHAEKS